MPSQSEIMITFSHLGSIVASELNLISPIYDIFQLTGGNKKAQLALRKIYLKAIFGEPIKGNPIKDPRFRRIVLLGNVFEGKPLRN